MDRSRSVPESNLQKKTVLPHLSDPPMEKHVTFPVPTDKTSCSIEIHPPWVQLYKHDRNFDLKDEDQKLCQGTKFALRFRQSIVLDKNTVALDAVRLSIQTSSSHRMWRSPQYMVGAIYPEDPTVAGGGRHIQITGDKLADILSLYTTVTKRWGS